MDIFLWFLWIRGFVNKEDFDCHLFSKRCPSIWNITATYAVTAGCFLLYLCIGAVFIYVGMCTRVWYHSVEVSVPCLLVYSSIALYLILESIFFYWELHAYIGYIWPCLSSAPLLSTPEAHVLSLSGETTCLSCRRPFVGSQLQHTTKHTNKAVFKAHTLAFAIAGCIAMPFHSPSTTPRQLLQALESTLWHWATRPLERKTRPFPRQVNTVSCLRFV